MKRDLDGIERIERVRFQERGTRFFRSLRMFEKPLQMREGRCVEVMKHVKADDATALTQRRGVDLLHAAAFHRHRRFVREPPLQLVVQEWIGFRRHHAQSLVDQQLRVPAASGADLDDAITPAQTGIHQQARDDGRVVRVRDRLREIPVIRWLGVSHGWMGRSWMSSSTTNSRRCWVGAGLRETM